ncbi:T9SS type A sorting domain-containing protein [Aequorivita sp. H23M31]|uniref:T9SS type A sorting domain-containing protein n=1 Tax=Aequorivita ciconiae TaxID=2494375 RepID=A0A410G2L4_9FLAO|nr:T9SS type A sorting domain-containing protein [Aequorivita sp. H23M31]QAA81493.1 T9SS type A sorting domain-containing protein [Aequorivita sp. H23M31]
MNKSLLIPVFIFLLSAFTLSAQWQPTGFNQSTWILCQTANGNLLSANDVYPDMGGIFISVDEGVSWEDTQAENYSYTAHLVDQESVYMGGVAGNVAISHDNGATWNTSSFGTLFPDSLPDDAIYAMTKHNDRIYASLFAYGVVYSTDQGASWILTDRNSLLDPIDPENGGQWTYNLVSFNGNLYNIGAFGIWEYDEIEDLWTMVDDTWYGSESLIVDDVLYVVYNASGIPAGIRYTTNLLDWDVMPLPSGVSTSVRTLEYYRGAFFMGHVNEAVFYSVDDGQTWNEYREDFPAFSPIPEVNLYGVPMNFVFSGDTMFAGVYSAIEGVGGVYKVPVPADVMAVGDMQISLHTVVYPNPATDLISFQFAQPIEGILTITDLMGRMIFQENLQNKNSISIDLNAQEWSTGLYLYSVRAGASTDFGKFIIR